MSDYYEKLSHPNWQKKRLQILERAGWKCQACGNDAETLQVHHLIYSRGEPWNSPDEHLECLCRSCHEWREEFNRFVGGRSRMTTAVCRAFCRFTGCLPKVLKQSAPQDVLKFCVYLGYVSPENVPEKWRPA